MRKYHLYYYKNRRDLSIYYRKKISKSHLLHQLLPSFIFLQESVGCFIPKVLPQSSDILKTAALHMLDTPRPFCPSYCR